LICFNGDVGTQGAADGRHLVSPACAPSPNRDPTSLRRNSIRAEPWPEGTKQGITTQFHFSVVIAPQPGSAFSSEVENGSRQENASNQESRAAFRFFRSGGSGAAAASQRSSSAGGSNQFVSDKPPSITIAAPVT
jgi:hypothetical protein